MSSLQSAFPTLSMASNLLSCLHVRTSPHSERVCHPPVSCHDGDHIRLGLCLASDMSGAKGLTSPARRALRGECPCYRTASNSDVERYRSPESGRMTTIVLPAFSDLAAIFRAAAMFAPQLMPQVIPSSRATR